MRSDETFGVRENNGTLCVTKKLIEQLNMIITFQRVVKYLICECVYILNKGDYLLKYMIDRLPLENFKYSRAFFVVFSVWKEKGG